MKIIEIIKNPNGYDNVLFIRINPESIQDTLSNILMKLMNLSWLGKFDEDYMKKSFETRAKKTVADIEKKFSKCNDDKITSDAGEYVISELAREALVTEFNYLDIPLAELLGMKKSGNPGFDFNTQNKKTDTVIFGEAKYNSRQSAYSVAMNQISDFIDEEKDIMQIADLQPFCTSTALERVTNGSKGFAVAFAAKATPSSNILDSIFKHNKFTKLCSHEELIFLAVNL